MPKVGRLIKEQTVTELMAQLGERRNIFVTSVGRLGGAEANTLRRDLHASQAQFVMVKRRLGQRALASLGIEGLAELLEGSVGLILPGEDVLPTAKSIVEFIKTHPDQVVVRGAVIDGQLMDQRRVEALADLPPKPVLLAQVVGTVELPLADLIMTIEQLVGDLAWIVEERAKQEGTTT